MHQRTFWVLCACLAGACAAPVGEPPELTEESSAGLLNGQRTYQSPEVGYIRVGGRCTATLFGSARTVITAAHCVDYEASAGPGRYGTFTIEPRAGQRETYTVRQIVSFGSGPGADDIALLQLAEAVPARVATPAPPIASRPRSGEQVIVYGYGCQERGTSTGARRKQALVFRWGERTAHLCQGDSGGPTLTREGEVAQINSGYGAVRGFDFYGDVLRNRSSLRAYVDAWRGSSPLVWEPGAARAPARAPGPESDCGDLAGLSDWTCTADGLQFAICGPAGLQTTDCPSGSECRPGSTELVCYR